MLSDEPIRMDEYLTSEFGQDPLFKLIKRIGATDELFDEHIMNLNFGIEYSTTDIEHWYCNDELKPATMRSWIKALEEYIEVRTVGNRGVLRLDYRAVFRVRMALLLREKNYKLQRVCQYAGVQPMDPEVINSRRSLSVPDQTAKEFEVMKALIGQMMAAGLIEIREGIPILRIQEVIHAHLQDAQKSLPDPKKIEEQLDQKVNDLREKLDEKLNQDRLQARQERLNSILTTNKITRQLEDEARELWSKKPEEERTKKIGLFKRIEDVEAKQEFIRKYVAEHFDERLRKEFE